MIEEEKNNNYLIKFLCILFLLFLIMYISGESGFYEYKTYTKTKLTKQAILDFEKDIEENKNININDYVISNDFDYSNNLTKLGSSIGSLVETIVNEGLKKTLKFLSALFYE